MEPAITVKGSSDWTATFFESRLDILDEFERVEPANNAVLHDLSGVFQSPFSQMYPSVLASSMFSWSH